MNSPPPTRNLDGFHHHQRRETTMKAFSRKPDKFPTRECPNCHKFFHARAKVCPACGTDNPTRAASAPQVRRARVKRLGKAVRTNAASPIEAAISFVEQAGGVENARAALGMVERIKGL